jgi:putative ABC transport system permease protein
MIGGDLKFALRQAHRQPALTAIAVATLALGIGANTAIFSFVNALLLRPLPFRDGDRLVRVHAVLGGRPGKLSVPELDELDQSGIFAGVAGFTDSQYNFAGGKGDPEEIPATIATRKIFDVLGTKPMLGSGWQEQDDRQRSFVVVLTNAFWKRKFGTDPQIVGKQLTMDGAPYTIAGVMPPGIVFPAEAEMFRCWGIAPQTYTRRNRSAEVVARLKPGTTMERAEADLAALSRRMEREHPDSNSGVRFSAESLRDAYVGDVRPYLLLLMGAVGVVLLIACSNIVNLLLSRSAARSKEFAVRAALGAGRQRLVRQMLTETVLLSVAGAIAGVALAVWWMGLLTGMIGIRLPYWMSIELDWRVLLFIGGIAIITGLLAGLAPAWKLSSPQLHDTLKEGSRGSSEGHHRLRGALVIIEVALAVVVLAGAGLLTRSFMALQAARTGINPAHLYTFRLSLPWRTYDKVRTFAFHRRAIEELRQIPGVTDVALNSNLPLSNKLPVTGPILLDGQSLDAAMTNPRVSRQRVSHNYHQLTGVPLRQGRFFSEDDREGSVPVVLVSERTARQFWQDQNPVGRRLNLNPGVAGANWYTVAGVVGDVRETSANSAASLDVYLSDRQASDSTTAYLLRVSGDPASVAQLVGPAIRKIDPEQSVFDAMPMEQRILNTVWQRRLSGVIFVLFGLLALALAAIGIYGVLSYMVTQRMRELGIRIALGASHGDIVGLVMRQGIGFAVAGIVCGIAAALVLARLLSSFLYGISASDPLTYLGVAAVLLFIACLAALAPALRALSADPIDALRQS